MDIQLLETGNGGDLIIQGNDLRAVYGVENMPYIGMFGGNANWWGNDLLFADNESFRFTSETNALLNSVALTSANRLLIESAIKRDLQFLLDNVPNTVLNIQTQIQSDNRLLINVDFGGVQFSMVWHPGDIAARRVPILPPVLVIWSSPIRGGVSSSYATTEITLTFGSSTAVIPAWVYYALSDEVTRVAYLNDTFAPANDMEGSFAIVGNNIVYNQGYAESWVLSTPPILLTKKMKVSLTAPFTTPTPEIYEYDVAGYLSYHVTDWGDGSDPVQYHPLTDSVITPSHTYDDALSAKDVNIFHDNTLIKVIRFNFYDGEYGAKDISGIIPTSLYGFLITRQPLTTPSHIPITNLIAVADVTTFISITLTTIQGFSPSLFANDLSNVENINLSNNKLTSAEVDEAFNDFVANSPLALSHIGIFVTVSQTPAAPPTGASLTARNALIAAGWTIITD